MPKMKLTKERVEAATHHGAGNFTIYQDTELKGFGLRVTANGAKTYIIDYRSGGRKRRMKLGRHGELAADKARELARAALGGAAAARLGLGEDPAEQQRRELEGDTFEDVATRYLEDLKRRAEAGAGKRGRLSGWESARGLWKRHVPAALKRRKVDDITTADVRRVHRKLADKPPTADHVKTVLHAVLEYARTEGLISGDNPAAAVKRYDKQPKRRRALTTEELAALGAVLDKVEADKAVTVTEDDGTEHTYGVDPAAALTLRLLVLTGMRKSELLGHHAAARRGPREGLRWGDVDLEAAEYELAAHRGGSGGKGGLSRTLPLGAATVELLRGVRPDDADPEDLVVPSPRNPSQPYNGLNKARRRIYRAAGIKGADAHCLRHTFESIGFSIAPGLAGALTGRALTRDATLNSYLHPDNAELREAADKVAGRIAQAMAGQLAGVVPIEERRARRGEA